MNIKRTHKRMATLAPLDIELPDRRNTDYITERLDAIDTMNNRKDEYLLGWMQRVEKAMKDTDRRAEIVYWQSLGIGMLALFTLVAAFSEVV